MQYDFNSIEEKWQQFWAENGTFKAENPGSAGAKKPKFYVLDMFPYPSGAGLHVGHPLGYIASDIYARYKRHKGFNVLHPMGYDSFGLPAEQYAIQTGQHPAITTEANIKTYRRQLDQMGFSFDWSREFRTSDPNYYKWTQWIFIQLFNSWYCKKHDAAFDIKELVKVFEKEGNGMVDATCDESVPHFSAKEWNSFSEKLKQEVLLHYRLTYLADADVNWCPALGTVLANDEIVNGVSERGGHPVVRKKMTQWMMRITAYAQRLLDGLDTVDWPQPLKDSQANWIGRSEGASATFRVMGSEVAMGSENAESSAEPIVADRPGASLFIDVFTTRPDTIFGVSFMTLAPEHELVSKITTADQKAEVEAYIAATAKRSERDRMADVKTISGAFTGAYAEHPFSKAPVPIWIGDYVLAGYGTGAVMSVPCGDQRDYDFAKHFGIDIPNIFKDVDISEEAFSDKEKTIITNSDFLDGLPYKKAIKKAIAELEALGQGEGKINYRLRDAVFSRQRYWGEPFPVYYKDGMPQMIADEHLPIKLPEVEKYLPTETGEPPLGNATEWAWDANTSQVVSNEKLSASNKNITPSLPDRQAGAVEGSVDSYGIYPLELNTMPGWAGSSQYFNRYMDSHNDDEIYSEDAINYWQDVDLYIGGSEHATGHLLYSRFWQKFMFDKGLVPVDEFAKKLINQGMITGTSAFVFGLWVSFFNYNSKFDKDFESKTIAKPVRRPFMLLVSKQQAEEAQKTGNFEIFEKWVKEKYPDSTPMAEVDEAQSTENVFSFKSWLQRIDVSLVNSSDEIDLEGLRKWGSNFDGLEVFEGEDYETHREVEKMSKSKYNVVNPDDIVKAYGADSLRMYEMFLGPLEQSKPWNTAGITGVHGFLKKLWKLYHSGTSGEFHVHNSPLEGGKGGVHEPSAETSQQTAAVKSPSASGNKKAGSMAESLKTLHKTIKKVEDDIQNFSFNTSVSTFMICVNELTSQKCTNREILEPLAILVSPYAPHIAEELWEKLGHTESISTAPFPKFEEKYLVESSKEYPISFNGKMRFTMELPLDLDKQQIEAAVMANDKTQQQLDGRTPKKVIVVPGKIVNIVG